MVPGTCTAGAPRAWMSVEALVTSTPKALCLVLVESFACEWQFAQLAAAKSSCGFLSAGAVLCAVWHCSHDWKWFPLAIGNPAGCVTLTACVATRCSAPFAWQRRQLAVSPPGAAPVPLHSAVAPPGPIRPACLAFWSAASWQAVQSTFVEAPVVWQLLQPKLPGTFTAGAPSA